MFKILNNNNENNENNAIISCVDYFNNYTYLPIF